MTSDMEKLTVLDVHGTPRAIGRQYGEAARSRLHASLDLFLRALSNLGASRESVLATARGFTAATRAQTEDGYEWLAGVAEGADLAIDEATTIAASLELAIAFGRIDPMCTSVIATFEATRGGVTLLAQNVDWNPDAHIDVVRAKHADGVETISIHLAGAGYYHLNAEGYGDCANLTVPAFQRLAPRAPLATWVPQAMRRRTLDDALEVFERHARGFGAFMLASKDGRALCLESDLQSTERVLPDRDVLVHSNHYECARFEPIDATPSVVPCTYARAKRMRALVDAAHGAIDAKVLMSFLADHENGPDRQVCRHVDPNKPRGATLETKASVVMEPAERRLWIALGPPCSHAWHEVRV